ncbi:ABC transporter ATP-binding protein [Shewanella canadensis]|uniref:ABC transporter ATP-binding protein n=1 Tax=Shewanella canadensis TaxID=271096 RepID=A0A3S0L3M3_9GAMM|nr:ABC transporter ATP-binding protein [Shewanella canadensis]RTR40414.1 ABC transporter ATP-binding protein [Shewanella canadensis]
MLSEVPIKLTDIVLKYDDFTALDGVSFEVEAGQTMALLGHNGAGKSSIIKVILGLIAPSSGSVKIMGKSAQSSHLQHKVNLGYLPEDVSFYNKLTGREVLNYFAALKRVRPTRVADLIDEFGLGYAQDRQLKTYSKGMKQRLGVAQAILSEPGILLLDEPTVGLDPQASQFLYGKINQLKNKGCAVVVSTHELSLVESHMDSALIMSKGRRLAQGTSAELSAESSLKAKIDFGELASWVERDHYLRRFFIDGRLQVESDQKQHMIKYLVSQCQIFDFTIDEPKLEDIYHDLMVHPLLGLPAQ